MEEVVFHFSNINSQNAIFHFSNIHSQENVFICMYIILYMPAYHFYICYAYISWHLASSDFFAKCHNSLYLKATRSKHLFCHVINTSLACEHFPSVSSSCFLLICCICILLWHQLCSSSCGWFLCKIREKLLHIYI